MRSLPTTRTIWLAAAVLLLVGADSTRAGGITADVGLTPPLDRWIFRTQIRYMERGDDPTPMNRQMNMYAVPAVLAYGLRPNVTLIGRQIGFYRDMDAPGAQDISGFGDFALISKWRALRINKPKYILGIAPTLGVELPTGDDDFGSDTWDLLTGLFFTARSGAWGADLNLQYTLNGVEDRTAADGRPGDVFVSNLALSYQFTLNESATMSLWPVFELTYTDTKAGRLDGNGMPNSGGELFTLAPGMRFARQSFMLEALIQFPIDQHLSGSQLELETSALVGMRYLF
ncbi:MAG TPA: transporter [Pontiella sp.]